MPGNLHPPPDVEPVMRSSTATRLATTAAAATLLVAACGDDESATSVPPASEPPATEPAATTPPSTTTSGQRLTIDDIEIDPDAEPAGNIFGGSAAAEPDPELVDPPDGGEQLTDQGETVECATEDDCPSATVPPDTLGQDALPPTSAFVPLPEHQPFCSLLGEISERPFPDDEFEQLVVTEAWLQELRPVTPDEIGAEMDVTIAFVDEIISSQSFDIEPDPDSEALVAIDTIGEFVDASCDV